MGSLFKPAIYLTALSDPERYTLLTPIDDGPFVWKSRGAPDWQPPNYDKKFHGMVPLRTALAHSYNAAAARLGTELGVERVLANVRRLGVEREVRPFASSMLGAVELSPFEVAQMYQTIASGGFRSPLRSIRESDHAGRPAASALSARGRAGVRSRADLPAFGGDAGKWCAKAPVRA